MSHRYLLIRHCRGEVRKKVAKSLASAGKSSELVVSLTRVFKLKVRTVVVLEQRVKGKSAFLGTGRALIF
jgi:hypothetical protein